MNPSPGKPRDHTCVLTLQAERPGGVPTVVDWWFTFLNRWGHRATALYAAFEGDGIGRWERLRQTIRTWRVHRRKDHPHPTLANAPLPAPLWLFYFMPQWIFGNLFDQFDQVVVAGGPCLHALPLALRRKRYILWLGTMYEDELRGKVLINDEWAKGILSSPFWPFLAWQERLVLRRASRILTQSPYTMRRVQEAVPEVSDRTELVMVPVDVSRFNPLPDDERDTGERFILNVSRINDPRKNIPLLLRAFARVHQQLPDVKLVLAGDEPGPRLQSLRDELGLEDAVVFKGKVSRDELVDLYRRAQLFVISSTQEGLGIVMLEAMACGTPVVATDCGGPEGIVINDQTGRLVSNNNADALVDAVTDLLTDRQKLLSMRRRCVNFIESHASPSVVEEQLHAAFAQTFPTSYASTHIPSERAEPRVGHLHEWLALTWLLLVLAGTLQHQFIIHWPSIQARLIAPLLMTRP